MERWRKRTRLPMILDALAVSEADPAARRLADAFGGDPVEVRERLIGEPAVRSRRLLFASGGEIILHDDTVAAVLLHLVPTPAAPRGIDLSKWLAKAGNNATFNDLEKAFDARWRFGSGGSRCFTLDGGYARPAFRSFGEKKPGDLLGIVFTAEEPWLTCRPEDDDCPACSDLLVRPGGRDGTVRGEDRGIDVDATIDALAAGTEAGMLTESTSWIPLADLQLLHASGLMERVESQFTCTACKRIICFTLFRGSSPTFGYTEMNGAMRRPLEAIPPVEQWGDAARIAADADAMHYVDHQPGGWFLVEQRGVLYLQARYGYSAAIDASVLIRLDESELEAYRAGGHDYLSDLAKRIHNSAPYSEKSPYRRRDLYRSPDSKKYGRAISAALRNHTWLAERRQAAADTPS